MKQVGGVWESAILGEIFHRYRLKLLLHNVFLGNNGEIVKLSQSHVCFRISLGMFGYLLLNITFLLYTNIS